MDYVCLNCKKTIEGEAVRKRIRCPYCGSKILVKKPVDMDRKLKAL